MKRLSCIVVAFIMLLTMYTGAMAENITVSVNDSMVYFDVAPRIEEGRTLVPLRAIFESLGADVYWDGATETVTATDGNTNVSLTVGETTMKVNSKNVALDVPAKVVDGRTLVPVRAVSEAFGCQVGWNSTLNRVHISDAPTLSELRVPSFFGEEFVPVNGNVPFFKIADYDTRSFEMYLSLDRFGRCSYAMGNLSLDTMPADARESISSVTPAGWHSVTYDVVPGKYLYNRCHLIGYQLSGENANESNLITGTRYLNTEAMLPFENMVADYIKETGNHVLYRVTPVYDGNNLLATGVLMEAMSVEDAGKGICFNVFCFNAQPQVNINYATGASSLSTDVLAPEDTVTVTYVLNINSLKFHYPHCGSASKIKSENRSDSYLTREELIRQGYSPCGSCKP